MKNPISNFLEEKDRIEIRPMLMGNEVYHLALPIKYWNFLDTLAFRNIDIEALLDDCKNNLIDDNPSKTLHWWLYWITQKEEKDHGIYLKEKKGLPEYEWFDGKQASFHNIKFMQIDKAKKTIAKITAMDSNKPIEDKNNAILSAYNGSGVWIIHKPMRLQDALQKGQELIAKYKIWKAQNQTLS